MAVPQFPCLTKRRQAQAGMLRHPRISCLLGGEKLNVTTKIANDIDSSLVAIGSNERDWRAATTRVDLARMDGKRDGLSGSGARGLHLRGDTQQPGNEKGVPRTPRVENVAADLHPVLRLGDSQAAVADDAPGAVTTHVWLAGQYAFRFCGGNASRARERVGRDCIALGKETIKRQANSLFRLGKRRKQFEYGQGDSREFLVFQSLWRARRTWSGG